MGRLRFYCENIEGSKVELSAQESHHLFSVMRVPAGDEVSLFDGKGKTAAGVVEKADNKKSVIRIKKVIDFSSSRGRKVVIAPSIPRSDRFDWLVEKCTELGVDGIYPVIFARTVKQPKNPRTKDRWIKKAISAVKQSERMFIPVVESPRRLEQTLEVFRGYKPEVKILFGSVSGYAKRITDVDLTAGDIIVFVGPEGGLTHDEEQMLFEDGAQGVRITKTVLRVETAAVAFAAVLSVLREGR